MLRILRVCALFALASAKGEWVAQRLRSRVENVNPFTGLLMYSCLSDHCGRGNDMPTTDSGAMSMEYVEQGFNKIAVGEGVYMAMSYSSLANILVHWEMCDLGMSYPGR
jgi:hypothetical protein